DVFWVGPDAAIGSTWWNAAQGQNWGDHQPFPITRPGAAQEGSAIASVGRTPNHLDVFWIGPDGAVASTWYAGAPGPSGAAPQPFPISQPGAARADSPIAAVGRTPNHLDVFWVGRDGAIGSTWYDGSPGQSWGDHQPFAIRPPGGAGPGEHPPARGRT